MPQTIEPTRQFIEEPLYEIVYGERRELEPKGAMQTLLASELCTFLREFAREKSLGVVVTEMMFLLNEQTNLQRRPDIAFVSYSRWPEETVDSSAAWNVVPDLAVEVVSPTNTFNEVERKITDYFDSGVQLVWVIEPEIGHVSVFDSPDGSRRLKRTDMLDGGNVLSGFELQLETLFAVTKRPN